MYTPPPMPGFRGFGAAMLAIAGVGCSFHTAGIAPVFSVDGGGMTSPDADGVDDALLLPPDAAQVDPVGVARTHRIPSSRHIRLDGDLSDWQGAQWTHFGGEGSHWDFDSSSGYSPSAQAAFASFFAADALYFAFQVWDDVVTPRDSDQLFYDDSVELYLDLGGDRSGPYETDDYYFLFGADGKGSCLQYMGFGGGPSTSLACGASSDGAGGSGYVVEARVPLAAPGPMNGAEIGVGVGVNDDDGLDPGRISTGYVYWLDFQGAGCTDCCPKEYAHPEPWCDTGRLGKLVFSN